MECNKDEAKRAKQIAEEKLKDRDTIGAKKFALKAQNLYPSLDGLPQLIDVIDMYISSEKKQNGETNYYEILGADPLSGEELLRKQYKRRALALHPDKNKSVGADGAFKLLSQAWSVLSDKEKRREYDLKLNIGEASNVNASTATPPVPAPERTPTGPTQNVRNPNYPQYVPIVPRPRNSVPHGTNPFSNPSYQNVSTSATAQQVPVVRPHSRPANNHRPTSSSAQTFWTCCNGCRTKYVYTKIFLNQNLLCPTCQQPFLATQIQAPSVSRRRGRPSQYSKQQQGVSATASASAAGSVPVSAPASGSGSGSASRSAKPAPASASTSAPAPASVPASVPASRSAEAASCQPSFESLKRNREQEEVDIPIDKEALLKNKSVPKKAEVGGSSRGLNSEKHDKKRRTDVQNPGDTGKVSQGTSMSNSGLKRKSGNLKQNVRSENESSYVKESSHIVRDMLMKKGKLEINRCLKFRESLIPKASEKSKVEETKNPENASEKTEKNTDEPLINQKVTLDESDGADVGQDETVLMDVPDANFHNFDEDRVEGSFSETHVWAAYDDDDGMPRYYALVQHVLSRNPFKMQFSWLNSKSTVEFGDHEWTRFGFTKTSGNFRAGKSVLSETLNSFSHQVKWNKGSRGAIKIFPTKGDVWALYRNWSPDWNALTDDEVIHKYDLVVVLEDYHEDRGVSVAPLVKVDGFTSVFKQLVDPTDVMKILRNEMFRFSHQVPYRVLNGLEGENAPNGCYELDPAALPLELLKVATDNEDTNGEKGKGKM